MTRTNEIRSIGLELGGGKSARTALVALDYYPKEKKIFVVETDQQIQGNREFSGDEVLLASLRALSAKILAVNAPLTLPPCFSCTLPVCPGYRKCEVPEVAWMREEGERLGLTAQKMPTPYTQRPIDVAMRGLLQQGLPVDIAFDETLGAGPAPLVARMRYLARHLQGMEFLEVSPKLVLLRLVEWFPISARNIKRYRDINEGLEHRLQILRTICANTDATIPSLFIYEEDLDSLARELCVFDALISALMACWKQAGLCEQNLPGFAPAWGSCLLPKRRLKERYKDKHE